MTEAQTIPEDVMKAAEEALDNLLCNCSESCGGYDGVRKASIIDIAKAILAERERCASIAVAAAAGRDWQRAEANAQNDKRAARDFESMKFEAVEIAAEIRKGCA